MPHEEFLEMLEQIRQHATQSQILRLNEAIAMRQEDLNFDLFERIQWIPEVA